jgi:hypothetical protein
MGQMAMNMTRTPTRSVAANGDVPGWVPRSVQNYIDHTEMGVPIRALARQQGCHASTILRQIRRVETLRDDPLVDGALKTLGGGTQDYPAASQTAQAKPGTAQDLPDKAELASHGLRVLRRLCETGAVLAVAADMEMAVIVRDGQGGESTRTGVVTRPIVEAMALQGWIAAPAAGRITRYHITAVGRSALADMMARNESVQAGGADHDTGETQETPRRIRYSLAESPLAALARRRDRDGERFLSDDLVRAGERLREDFEMAQMADEVSRDWDQFLATLRSASAPLLRGGSVATQNAHKRVITALQDIGPGLSDVTLRCCCFLEGLETAEKTLGWSARSGKIVLRIALMGLKRHYAENADPRGALIG